MKSTEVEVEKCLETLRAAQRIAGTRGDIEVAHVNADTAIIEFIRFLGFAEIADEWEKVHKWYA